jgi:hypothetical protein
MKISSSTSHERVETPRFKKEGLGNFSWTPKKVPPWNKPLSST